MAFLHCDFSSESLKMATAMVVVLPETIAVSDADVIYLLHGLSDNCTGWTRYTAVERYAREQDAVLIMPEVQRSFYTNMKHGAAYFDFIAEELPEKCRQFFGISSKREKNYIMGLSMGGYGALKCALTNPLQYAGVASFSAVTDMKARIKRATPEEKQEFTALFGADLVVPAGDDLYALAGNCPKAALPIRMYCGEEDGLYAENEAFAEELEKEGQDVKFEHWQGAHEWNFWDEAVRRAMESFLGGKSE